MCFGSDPKQREVKCKAYQISDDCISCGVCASNCPVGAISEGDGKFVIDADTCIDCALARRTARWALRLRPNPLELADVFGLAGCVFFCIWEMAFGMTARFSVFSKHVF